MTYVPPARRSASSPVTEGLFTRPRRGQVIHADLKPDNLMADRGGGGGGGGEVDLGNRVRLIDFSNAMTPAEARDAAEMQPRCRRGTAEIPRHRPRGRGQGRRARGETAVPAAAAAASLSRSFAETVKGVLRHVRRPDAGVPSSGAR